MQELLQAGTIRHVGLSTHNPEVALEAVRRGVVEVIMFSINPAFDLLPPSEDVNDLFGDFANAGGADPSPEGGVLQSLRGK